MKTMPALSCLDDPSYPRRAPVHCNTRSQQVEELRLGLRDNDKAFAVQQWQSLIAINYPARAYGITRYTWGYELLGVCVPAAGGHEL